MRGKRTRIKEDKRREEVELEIRIGGKRTGKNTKLITHFGKTLRSPVLKTLWAHPSTSSWRALLPWSQCECCTWHTWRLNASSVGAIATWGGRQFHYRCHINVEGWHKMWIYVFVPSEKFSSQRVNKTTTHSTTQSCVHYMWHTVHGQSKSLCSIVPVPQSISI